MFNAKSILIFFPLSVSSAVHTPRFESPRNFRAVVCFIHWQLAAVKSKVDVARRFATSNSISQQSKSHHTRHSLVNVWLEFIAKSQQFTFKFWFSLMSLRMDLIKIHCLIFFAIVSIERYWKMRNCRIKFSNSLLFAMTNWRFYEESNVCLDSHGCWFLKFHCAIDRYAIVNENKVRQNC